MRIWAINRENVWSRQSQRNVRFSFATPPWGGDLEFGNFGNLGDYYGECMEQAYFGENLGDYYGECMEQAKIAKCPVFVSQISPGGDLIFENFGNLRD